MSSDTQADVKKSVLGHVDGLTQWAFLLNGAAAAGLLTFLGNSLEKKALFAHWPAFSTAILFFAGGLLFAVLTRVATLIALNYLAQTRDPPRSATAEELRINLFVGDQSVIFGLIALGCFVVSSVCFLAGVLSGRYALFG